jgi:molecular chaperone GrpE
MHRDPGDQTAPQDSSAIDATDQALTEGDELQQLRTELEAARKNELRAQAEMENFRKRIQRDTEQTLKYASISLVRDLLDVVDNLTRATQAAEGATSSDSLLSGVKMVHQQLLGVLAKHQCRPIQAVGENFDPNIHQAINEQPSDQIDAGKILMEASVGYTMHDRVVRPSHVIVSTGRPTN